MSVSFAGSLGPCCRFFPVLSDPVCGGCWQLLTVPAVLRHCAMLPHHCVPVLGLPSAPGLFPLSAQLALVLPLHMSLLIPQSCCRPLCFLWRFAFFLRVDVANRGLKAPSRDYFGFLILFVCLYPGCSQELERLSKSLYSSVFFIMRAQ